MPSYRLAPADSVWVWLAACAGAYLLTSLNFSLLASRLAGRPAALRRHGSGNPGATNALRALGPAWALAVLLADVLRAACVSWAAMRWLPPLPAFAVCLCALLGNLFPLYHGFRGGKGVAHALGLVAGLDLASAGLGALVWVLVAWLSRYASLASLCMLLSYPICMAVFSRGWPEIGFALVALLVICASHRHNIRRLLRGQERRLLAKNE
ncbi:MAG: glycerol-3-phosphate acyltransferase [Deltaproteobacteria bacterium]|nr:glycerol-3-phosphate acyltransferase [Deltaproteobacteria bacterium]